MRPLLFLALAACSPLAGGDISFGYPVPVEGVVQVAPTTRYVRSEHGGSEKIGLTIGQISTPIPANMMDAGGGIQGELMVECGSTRCSQLQPGDRVVLDCRTEGRFLEPSVVLCKHNTTKGHAIPTEVL